MMEMRQFGTSGLTASALGMGCSRLGSFLSTSSDNEAVATIRLALERGITYFDTSDIYAQGDSERLLGAALRGQRERVLLATKAGRRFTNNALMAARLKAPIKFAMRVLPALQQRVRRTRTAHISSEFSLAYLTSALDASLQRLNTDWVDIFMLHSPPAEVLADEELFHGLGRLTVQGKIRCLGVSVAEIGQVSLAANLPNVRAIQVPIGAPHRAISLAILPRLSEQGVAIVGREIFEGEEQPIKQETLHARMREALGHPGVSVVLIGMSSREHLEENLAVLP
jgi:aryl-alcohol dehydrogenase-like predicted oxidoreductase